MEFLVNINEMPAFFNSLYIHDNFRVEIYPYSLERSLFEFILDMMVDLKLLLSLDAYSKIFTERELFKFPDIVPSFEYVRNILLSSGFLKMSNWQEVVNRLNSLLKVNLAKGQRHTFIAMDTNCFMNRLYSVLVHQYENKISEFYFDLSRIVKFDLRYKNAIFNDQLNELKQLYKQHSEIFNEFWLGDAMRDRHCHIRNIEFRKMRKLSHHLIDNSVEINDKVYREFQIIEDYRRQVLSQHHDVLFLSSDKKFSKNAEEAVMYSFYLEKIPLKEIPKTFKGTWR